MVRRTTIDIDEALLAEAQQVLGTTGLRDTVDGALTAVIRTERRRRLARRLRTQSGLDFDVETAEQARTWRAR